MVLPSRRGLIALAVGLLSTPSHARSMPPTILYFAPLSDTPEREQRADLIQSALIGAVNYIQGPVLFVVAGHADRTGDFKENIKLSCARAKAVGRLLMGRGVPANRIEYQGFGETRPAVDTNDDIAEGRNRRVEITYLPWTPDHVSGRNCD